MISSVQSECVSVCVPVESPRTAGVVHAVAAAAAAAAVAAAGSHPCRAGSPAEAARQTAGYTCDNSTEILRSQRNLLKSPLSLTMSSHLHCNGIILSLIVCINRFEMELTETSSCLALITKNVVHLKNHAKCNHIKMHSISNHFNM